MARVVQLCCVLVGLIAVLVQEYSVFRPMRDKPAIRANLTPLMILPQTQVRVGVNAQADIASITARPLFIESRRPPPAFGPVSEVLPRLTGVLISGHNKTAIFATVSGERSVALAEGNALGAYVINAIGAGEVTVTGPDGTRVLRPAFSADRNQLARDTQVAIDHNSAVGPAQIYKGPAMKHS